LKYEIVKCQKLKHGGLYQKKNLLLTFASSYVALQTVSFGQWCWLTEGPSSASIYCVVYLVLWVELSLWFSCGPSGLVCGVSCFLRPSCCGIVVCWLQTIPWNCWGRNSVPLSKKIYYVVCIWRASVFYDTCFVDIHFGKRSFANILKKCSIRQYAWVCRFP
jgi:hypothetical protein